jgi:hypothetical protein
MMVSDKVFSLFASAVICLLLLVAGCAQTPALALRFMPEDSTTYRVTTETEKSLELEGDTSSDTSVEGGHANHRAEMTFTQQIQEVDDKGNAVALITIKELKYFSKVKDKIDAEFDSSREKDSRGPLAKLIGQSYMIKVSPAGEVIDVLDVRKALAAVRGGTAAHEIAKARLRTEAIKARHTVPGLPAAGNNQVRRGDNWSNIKSFSYGGRVMAPETYERVYTLKELKDIGGHRIALVEMNAIPSSEMAKELHKEQGTSDFSKMFDSTKTYTGRLELDLTAGKVANYFEEMQTEWFFVDTAIRPGEDKPPPALKMGFIHRYSLERID